MQINKKCLFSPKEVWASELCKKDSTILNTVNTLVCMSGEKENETNWKVQNGPYVTDFVAKTDYCLLYG